MDSDVRKQESLLMQTHAKVRDSSVFLMTPAKKSSANKRYAMVDSNLTVAVLLTLCEILSRIQAENLYLLLLYFDCRPIAGGLLEISPQSIHSRKVYLVGYYSYVAV